MEENYIIPKETSEFDIGTKYQVEVDGQWLDRIITKLCFSVRVDLRHLIEQKRIRITK